MSATNGFDNRAFNEVGGREEFRRFVDTEAMVKVIAEETIKRMRTQPGNPTGVLVIPAVRYMA